MIKKIFAIPENIKPFHDDNGNYYEALNEYEGGAFKDTNHGVIFNYHANSLSYLKDPCIEVENEETGETIRYFRTLLLNHVFDVELPSDFKEFQVDLLHFVNTKFNSLFESPQIDMSNYNCYALSAENLKKYRINGIVDIFNSVLEQSFIDVKIFDPYSPLDLMILNEDDFDDEDFDESNFLNKHGYKGYANGIHYDKRSFKHKWFFEYFDLELTETVENNELRKGVRLNITIWYNDENYDNNVIVSPRNFNIINRFFSGTPRDIISNYYKQGLANSEEGRNY